MTLVSSNVRFCDDALAPAWLKCDRLRDDVRLQRVRHERTWDILGVCATFCGAREFE